MHYPEEIISNFTLGSEPDKNSIKALLDPRDCTFKLTYFLEELYSIDNCPYEFLKMSKYDDWKCNYIVPNFLENFEIRGEKCFAVLYQKVVHLGLNLGFMLEFFPGNNYAYLKNENFQ